jgi:hypothetical protein
LLGHYILDGQTPVIEPDILKWAKWREEVDRNDKRRVALAELPDCKVSTVFLATAPAARDGRSLLFETMIFGGEHDQKTWRWYTWSKAEEGHQVAVRLASE